MNDNARLRRLAEAGVRVVPIRPARHSVGAIPSSAPSSSFGRSSLAGGGERHGLLSGFGAEPEFWDAENWTVGPRGDLAHCRMRSSGFTAKFQDASGKLRMFSDTSLGSLIRSETRKVR